MVDGVVVDKETSGINGGQWTVDAVS